MPEEQILNRDLQSKADSLRNEIGDKAFEEVVESARRKVLERRGESSSGNMQGSPEAPLLPDSSAQLSQNISPQQASKDLSEGLSAEVLEEVLEEISGGTSKVNYRDSGSADEITKKLMNL